MTEVGRKHVTRRLGECDTLADLQKVWEGLGFEYQAHPEIRRLKDERKEQLTDGRAA